MNESVSLVLFIYGLAVVVAMAGAVLIKLIVGVLALGERRAAAVAAGGTPPPVAPMAAAAIDGIPAHHLVAIAAAAHAMVGAHRILHIGGTAAGKGWSTEGRLAQHSSHHPSTHH